MPAKSAAKRLTASSFAKMTQRPKRRNSRRKKKKCSARPKVGTDVERASGLLLEPMPLVARLLGSWDKTSGTAKRMAELIRGIIAALSKMMAPLIASLVKDSTRRSLSLRSLLRILQSLIPQPVKSRSRKSL